MGPQSILMTMGHQDYQPPGTDRTSRLGQAGTRQPGPSLPHSQSRKVAAQLVPAEFGTSLNIPAEKLSRGRLKV